MKFTTKTRYAMRTMVEIAKADQETGILQKDISENHPVTLVNSLNPFRIEGQKSGSFEICDYLGQAPNFHVIPVGNAGNITAYWKGYREYREAGKINSLPRMLGFQAEGAAPIVRGYPIEKPETLATAIRIGNPASWKTAVAARDESGGLIETVTDVEIVDAYRMLARVEGVFAEPASAASIAGLLADLERGRIPDGSIIVCTVTGHGLKDPDTAIRLSEQPVTVPAEMDAVRRIIVEHIEG